MAQLTLTTTAQELTGSSAGCLVSCPTPFLFGFGSTAPTTWAKYEKTEPMDYGGAYGSLWVKSYLDTLGTTPTLTYFVAV